MSSITISDVNKAVESTLGKAKGLARTAADETITEGVNDLPYLMVYSDGGNVDSGGGGTAQTTFRGGVRQTAQDVFVDVYVKQRSHIGLDLAKTYQCADAVISVLEEQEVKPYFGLAGLQAFNWSWERVTFVYGDPNISYAGVRFTLAFTIF